MLSACEEPSKSHSMFCRQQTFVRFCIANAMLNFFSLLFILVMLWVV